MVFSFPREIRANCNGAKCLSDMSEWFRRAERVCDDVVVDVSQVRWFDANLCAALGVLLARKNASGLRVHVIGDMHPALKSVLSNNGFWGVEIDGQPFDLNLNMNKFYGKSYLPYRRFEVDEHRAFTKQYARMFIQQKCIPNMTECVQKMLTDSLGELFDNARTHSETMYGVFVCGQNFPKKHQVHLTVADGGIGFRSRILKSRKEDWGPAGAIDWAMAKTNTTRTEDISGGVGLKMLRFFIELNRGFISVVSDRGYWELGPKGVFFTELERSFPGTVVSVIVNTADDNSYATKAELAA